jgi:molybdate transport system substrate-binding protein
MQPRAWRMALAALVAGAAVFAHAATAQVAVAANFTQTLQAIAADFERDTGHRLLLSSGSTGKLAAQITHGAPFDVLLSADAETAAQLEKTGLAVAGSRFVYATGALVLWSPDPSLVDAQGNILRTGHFAHLAIAAPRLAPYGGAAADVIARMGLTSRLAPRLVQGESIAQAFNFVASGNAELGFVALSQLQTGGAMRPGSVWMVPPAWHRPLRQEAVLLGRGRSNPAARALLQYLKGERALATMRAFGYRP